MTEREGGSGKPKDNVSDELDEATEHRKTSPGEAVETEETGGGGGVKDNVKDEWDESQRH